MRVLRAVAHGESASDAQTLKNPDTSRSSEQSLSPLAVLPPTLMLVSRGGFSCQPHRGEFWRTLLWWRPVHWGQRNTLRVGTLHTFTWFQ